MGRVYAASIKPKQTNIEATESIEIVETPLTTTEPIKVQQSEPTQENVCIAAMKQVFPKDTWAIATAVMTAENRKHNPNALSKTGDRGCFQINESHLDMTNSLEAMFNPEENIRLAYSISHQGTDWSGWTTYTSGAYKRFL